MVAVSVADGFVGCVLCQDRTRLAAKARHAKSAQRRNPAVESAVGHCAGMIAVWCAGSAPASSPTCAPSATSVTGPDANSVVDWSSDMSARFGYDAITIMTTNTSRNMLLNAQDNLPAVFNSLFAVRLRFRFQLFASQFLHR